MMEDTLVSEKDFAHHIVYKKNRPKLTPFSQLHCNPNFCKASRNASFWALPQPCQGIQHKFVLPQNGPTPHMLSHVDRQEFASILAVPEFYIVAQTTGRYISIQTK